MNYLLSFTETLMNLKIKMLYIKTSKHNYNTQTYLDLSIDRAFLCIYEKF